MNKVRILYPLRGDTIGGSHLSTLALASNLSKAYEPLYLLHHTNGPLAAHVGDFHDGSHIAYPTSIKNTVLHPIQFIKSLSYARAFIKTHNINLIHGEDGPLQYIWLCAAKLSEIPYVHSQHTLLKSSHLKSILYKCFDSIVSCSESVSRSLPPSLRKNTHIAYPVINEATPLEHDNSDFDLENHTNPVISFVANMRNNKRPMIFLRMARAILKHKPHVKFFMAGQAFDDLDQEIERFIQDNNMSDSIKILGFYERALTLIAHSDILVVPAVHDAFGRTLVEAMRNKTAVIAANSGGHTDIITDGVNGHLITPDDVEEFCTAALSLLDDSALLERITQAAYAHVDKTFTPQASVTIYENIYHALTTQA